MASRATAGRRAGDRADLSRASSASTGQSDARRSSSLARESDWGMIGKGAKDMAIGGIVSGVGLVDAAVGSHVFGTLAVMSGVPMVVVGFTKVMAGITGQNPPGIEELGYFANPVGAAAAAGVGMFGGSNYAMELGARFGTVASGAAGITKMSAFENWNKTSILLGEMGIIGAASTTVRLTGEFGVAADKATTLYDAYSLGRDVYGNEFGADYGLRDGSMLGGGADRDHDRGGGYLGAGDLRDHFGVEHDTGDGGTGYLGGDYDFDFGSGY